MGHLVACMEGYYLSTAGSAHSDVITPNYTFSFKRTCQPWHGWVTGWHAQRAIMYQRLTPIVISLLSATIFLLIGLVSLDMDGSFGGLHGRLSRLNAWRRPRWRSHSQRSWTSPQRTRIHKTAKVTCYWRFRAGQNPKNKQCYVQLICIKRIHELWLCHHQRHLLHHYCFVYLHLTLYTVYYKSCPFNVESKRNKRRRRVIRDGFF